MHHKSSNPHKFPQTKPCHYEPSEISLELSLLIPSTFPNKTKQSFQKNTRKKTWKSLEKTIIRTRPNKENLKNIWNNNNINNNKNTMCWGCSTSLELYDNPWKIKKALMASDLGKLNRLLFGSNLLENLMLSVLGAKAQRDAESGIGTPIRVWDVDTMTMHELILKRWASFKSYVLIGKWTQDFVRRRDLKKGDVIGLHWDSYRQCFNFSVLKRMDQLTI